MAWSYSRDWTCGQVFISLVVWWLRSFGFTNRISLRIDGGTEWHATSCQGAFEESLKTFFHPLDIFPKVIRKGHPEDNNFVERFHGTDDYEFYILYLPTINNETQWIKRCAWWQKVYNLIRPQMALEILLLSETKKPWVYYSQSLLIFPTFLLDRLAASPTVFTKLKSAQDPLL